MNDQQRIETSADNCEVLRERLARYEDAEGNPLAGAGAVDERAAFEAWSVENHFGTRRPFANSNNYESGYTDFCWKAWQARAALSAPSHGEQVREGWQLVPVDPTEDMLGAMRAKHWEIRGCQLCEEDYRDIHVAMLAAAPSAGSQEQGE